MPDFFSIQSPEGLALGITFLGITCIALSMFRGWQQSHLDTKGERFFLNLGNTLFYGGIMLVVLILYPVIRSNVQLAGKDIASIIPTRVIPTITTPTVIPPSTQLQANQIILTRVSLVLIIVFSVILGLLLALILASFRSSPKSNPPKRLYDDINLSEIRPDSPKNEIYFNILNDKSSPIVVKNMYFYKRDARWVQGESNWPHVYSKGNVEIDAKASHTGRFIAEDDSQKSFSIIGYAPDKQDLDMTGFPIGAHKFDIKIVFALKDNLDYDLYKYFTISVNYKGSSQFHLDVRHRN